MLGIDAAAPVSYVGRAAGDGVPAVLQSNYPARKAGLFARRAKRGSSVLRVRLNRRDQPVAFPNLDGVFLGQKPCALGGGFVVQAIK